MPKVNTLARISSQNWHLSAVTFSADTLKVSKAARVLHIGGRARERATERSEAKNARSHRGYIEVASYTTVRAPHRASGSFSVGRRCLQNPQLDFSTSGLLPRRKRVDMVAASKNGADAGANKVRVVSSPTWRLRLRRRTASEVIAPCTHRAFPTFSERTGDAPAESASRPQIQTRRTDSSHFPNHPLIRQLTPTYSVCNLPEPSQDEASINAPPQRTSRCCAARAPWSSSPRSSRAPTPRTNHSLSSSTGSHPASTTSPRSRTRATRSHSRTHTPAAPARSARSSIT